jgi:hypothetical protein
MQRSFDFLLAGFSFLLFVAAAAPVQAQPDPDSGPRALNLTIGEVGLSIGDSRRTTGLRLNYRDRALERVNGLNVTLWRPHDDARGTVNGIAAGLPLTGGERLRGIAVGAGLSAQRAVDGIAVAPFGLGSGGRVRGVAVGGLGLGAGSRAQGVLVGGLGAGAGEQATGILIGGLGAGAGRRVAGIVVGGAGAGAGESASGVLVGGLGAGTGGRATGLLVGGVGAGAGTTVNGIGLAAIGVGAGDRFNGIGIAGVGVAAGEAFSGLALAGASVVSRRVTGLALAGGYTRVNDGALRGISVAAYNDIRAPQRGLTIGVYNYARELHGVQLGIVNVARNNPVWARFLPGMNLNL